MTAVNRAILVTVIALMVLAVFGFSAAAAAVPVPRISFGLENSSEPGDIAVSLQILALLTVLSLAPALIMMMTSFTRVVIVLSFVRNALATNQMPPNQVLVGLALFLTFFIMAPTWQVLNEQALQPYLDGQISQAEALQRAEVPIRDFLLRNTREKDIALFVQLHDSDRPVSSEDVSLLVLVPAFVISELKSAFQLGFIIFIPFIVIDMIVASTLMSMGMMMLPPVMISLPFKILLFIMVDGWHLLTRSLLLSFQ